MSTTPHYGYSTDIPAIGLIDRDLKRIEDKADTSLLGKVDKQEGHGLIADERRDQIVINRENIACLASRLDGYAGKCDLELHNLNPNAHRDLFDRKVDKLEGHGLISDEDLAQIALNKGNIEVNQQNITLIRNIIADMYSKGEIDELLANKANKDERIVYYDLELENDFTPVVKPVFMKDSFGWISLFGSIGRVEAPTASLLIATLPEGFRPGRNIPVGLSQVRGASNTSWATYGWIDTNGEFSINTATPSGFSSAALGFNVVYKAAQ